MIISICSGHTFCYYCNHESVSYVDVCIKNLFSCFVEASDSVLSVIERAKKDIAVKSALDTFEEVWLSRSFCLVPYQHRASDKELDVDMHGGTVATSAVLHSPSRGPSASVAHNRSSRRQTLMSSCSSSTSQSVVINCVYHMKFYPVVRFCRSLVFTECYSYLIHRTSFRL